MTKKTNIAKKPDNTRLSHYPLPNKLLDAFLKHQQDFLEVQSFILTKNVKTFASSDEEIAFCCKVADGFAERQEYAQAANFLVGLTEKYPDHCPLYAKIADFLVAMGEYEDACATLREATKREPKNVTYWLKAVQIFMKSYEYKAAHTCLEKVFELNPHGLMGKRLLAQLYAEIEQDQEAELIFEDIESTGLDDPDAELVQAKLRFRQGKIDEALTLYATRFDISDSIPDSYPQFENTTHWSGEDLNGKSLFLAYEAASPNHLLFMSMIPRLYEKFPKALLILETKPEYESFLATSFPKAHVISAPILTLNQRFIHMYDAHNFKCDYWLPSGCLLNFMKDFPLVPNPVFSADEDKLRLWEAYFKPYANKLTVGIDLQLYPNAMPQYEYWAELLRLESCKFVSLNPLQDQSLFPELGILPCPYDRQTTFDEQVACTKQLNAVIAPFGNISILAAGLGVKTLQLTASNDWRMLGSEKSPWFPEAHILKHTLKAEFEPQINEFINTCLKILT